MYLLYISISLADLSLCIASSLTWKVSLSLSLIAVLSSILYVYNVNGTCWTDPDTLLARPESSKITSLQGREMIFSMLVFRFRALLL